MIKYRISIRMGIECLCSSSPPLTNHIWICRTVTEAINFNSCLTFALIVYQTVDFIESPEYKVCSRIIYCFASDSRKKCNWLIHALRVVDCLLFRWRWPGYGTVFNARIYALSGRAEEEATAIGHISRLLGCDCRGGWMEQFALSQINLPTTHGNGDIYGTCITRIVEYFMREEKVQDNQSIGSDRINVRCSLILFFKILCHSHQIRQLQQFNLFVCSSSSYKFA